MRYHVRDKILELLPTIIEGINYIKKADLQNTQMVYEDCTVAFESIRTTLEDSLTEKRFIDYHELILNIEETLDGILTRKKQNRRITNESLHFVKLVRKLEESLRKEPEAKLEILFIPYKYSMWDSLESIWETAEKDPRCNAYVMPIPYYERDENGLLADLNYEIEDFINNDIPVVSYKEFDYTVIRPDVIYYHNPYDGNNRVTSVSPEFYSDNLKHYTDMLVYVPYFVAIPYEDASIASGFSTSPGVSNASKVILQSAPLKEVYVENGVCKEKLEVLGSPKIDAMLKEQVCEVIPPEWRNLKDKKIILYNSSIASLLNNESYFKRLKKHFQEILNNDNKCALIWRPHPLLEATINSMKPEVADDFKNIKELVLNSTNGVIDVNASVSPAFSISDGLITDRSSLIQSYILTEKPIYIMDIPSEPTEDTFVCSDIYSCYFEEELPFESFVNMLINDEDPVKANRISNFKNSIVNSDGSCGLKVHSFIIDEVLRKNPQTNKG